MSKDFSVHVEHVTRVEGHGNIILDVKNGKIEKLQWNVVEAPRFFEAMQRGQHYNELRPITSRICGICSIGHSLASLKATEDALEVNISKQTAILRAGLALVPVFLPWRLVIELLGMLGYGRRSWGRIARADDSSQHVNR